MDKKQIQVLLLEDEAAHAEAIRRALESTDGDLELHVVVLLKDSVITSQPTRPILPWWIWSCPMATVSIC